MPIKSFAWRIYLAALILRLIPVLMARGLGIGLDDMFQYDMLARSLASGNGYRWYAQADMNLIAPYIDIDPAKAENFDPLRGIATSFRAPLYPTFLAIIYTLNGMDFSRFFAARLAQVMMLSAPLAPLTYMTAQKLFPGREAAARSSAWVVAGYPMLMLYPLGLGTENLFFILVLASFLLILRARENAYGRYFLLSGLLLGLACLTRSVIFPFAALAIIWLWVYASRRGAVLAAIALFLCVSPWVVRNSLLHGRLTGIEASMGYNLYLGYYPEGDGSFIFGPSLDLLTILDDAERDRIGTQKAAEFITARPDRFIPLALNRLGYFFGLEKRVLMYFYSNNLVGYIPPLPLLLLSFIIIIPFIIIAISAVLGFTAFTRKKPGFILLLVFIFTYLIPHVFILSEDRFHLALIPFLAILASQFWFGGSKSMATRWSEGGPGRWVVIIGGLICVLMLANWGFELNRDSDKIAALFSATGNQTYLPY